MLEFVYDGEFDMRVDKFLSNRIEWSRSFCSNLIDKNAVMVNNKNVKKSYKISKNDKIIIKKINFYNSYKCLAESPLVDIDIKFETDDYAVVYKPKWVLSHPNSQWNIKDTPSLVGQLYHMYWKLPSSWTFLRMWIVHRLDKATDGLMIVAKSNKGLKYFQKLFKEKSKAQNISSKEAVKLIKMYKARSVLTSKGKSFLKSITKLPYYIDKPVKTKSDFVQNYKRWITKILDYKINNKYVDFDIEILTWRTHQIRYHLSSEGLDVLWDDIYGTDSFDDLKLTAYKLFFQDLKWVYRKFELNFWQNGLKAI